MSEYRPSCTMMIAGGLAVMALAGGLLSYRPVRPQNLGVVTRFGVVDRVEHAGPHFIVPLYETMKQVDVNTVRTAEIGYTTVEPAKDGKSGVYRQASNDDAMRLEAQMLTADRNIVWASMVVQYKVDPNGVTDYLYNVEDVEVTIDLLGQAALRQTVGDYGVDEVLTFARQEISDKVESKLQELVDINHLGIKITSVQMQNTQAPIAAGTDPNRTVADAFNDVRTAEQNAEARINQAKGYQNKVVTEAQGQANKLKLGAEQYKAETIGGAQRQVAEFDQMYPLYQKDPQGTIRRLYVDTMTKIFPHLDVILIDQSLESILQVLDLTGGGTK